MKFIWEPGQDFRKILAFLNPTTLSRHIPGYLEPQLLYKVIVIRPRTGIQLSHDSRRNQNSILHKMTEALLFVKSGEGAGVY